MMKWTAITLALLPMMSHALETDNYLSWGIELEESRSDINKLIEDQINDTLTSSDGLSCEQVTMQIAHRFKTTPFRKLFEDWSNEFLSAKMYPQDPYYLHQSIYRNTKRFYKKYSGLSPNVQVNGIYFGVDKLSHFGSTGRRYLKEYLKFLKNGYSEKEATEAAIRLGLDNEATVLGIWAAGVFSYGDMEANFQGFRFYKKLCLDKSDTYLSMTDGKWKLRRSPDIKEYVNPFWDESFNLSYRAPGTWGHSSLVIREEYCPMLSSESVTKRKAWYDALVASTQSDSLDYIRTLQAEAYYRAPRPLLNQSIEQLCSEANVANLD